MCLPKKLKIALALGATVAITGGAVVAAARLSSQRNNSIKPAAEKQTTSVNMDNLPDVIMDDTINDWVVDRFIGNTGAGKWFCQGPAREVSNFRRPGWGCEAGDGTIYLTFDLMGGSFTRLIKVTPDGALRLVMEGDGMIEGPIEMCQAGVPVWNPKDKTLYITGPNCLRKVVEKSDGSSWVEVVAGIPGKAGHRDGQAAKAMFQSQFLGVVCNSEGTFYWFEGNGTGSSGYLEKQGLRRIKNGVVSTVPLKFVSGDRDDRFNVPMADGGCINLGGNNETLYLMSLHVPSGIFKCDLKTGELTRVCGMRAHDKRNRRGGRESDGPAITHAGSKGGVFGLYDPYYNAFWLSGADTVRFRWMRLNSDGWVRTVGGKIPKMSRPKMSMAEVNGLGFPAKLWRLNMSRHIGLSDSRGGLYFSALSRSQPGVWRLYNKNWPSGSKKNVLP